MAKDTELNRPVEHMDGIHILRGRGHRREWNGIEYATGLSGKNVDARELSMNLATIPPGGVAAAHIHQGFEVMLYFVRGRVLHEFGTNLEKAVENQAGDFMYIEPGVPHEVTNLSDDEPVVAVVARSDPDEWDNIVDYRPEG